MEQQTTRQSQTPERIEKSRCPQCGSSNTVAYAKWDRRCDNCGYIWEITIPVQQTPIEQTVNSIKLTKLERKILSAIFEGRKPSCPEFAKYEVSIGSDYEGIAEIVFGDSVLHTDKKNGHFCTDLSVCYAAKASLCRSLKNLFKKGLVKKCHPIYRRGWQKPDEWDKEHGIGAFYTKVSEELRVTCVNEQGQTSNETLRIGQYQHLPHRCHVWWMLTEKGMKYAKEGAAQP